MRMYSRDYRDVIGGVLLFVLGSAVCWYSAQHYELGSFRRMGPGMFPLLLGLVLVGFAFVIGVPALFRQGVQLRVRVWSPIFVLSGVASFAILVGPFGLIPAVLGVVVVSSLAELKVRPVSLMLLSAAMCLIAWLIFRVGLGMTMPMFRWPF